MNPFSVIESFNIFKETAVRLLTGYISFMIYQFSFQCLKNIPGARHHKVILKFSPFLTPPGAVDSRLLKGKMKKGESHSEGKVEFLAF